MVGLTQEEIAPQEPIALGTRINNPLNIRKTVDVWQGAVGEEAGFVAFNDLGSGLRAADRTLESYGSRHGINTVADVVARWAPPEENDTVSYTQFVANTLGVDANDEIDLTDPQTRSRLISAMGKMETGELYDSGFILEAVASTNREGGSDTKEVTREDLMSNPTLREGGYTVGDIASLDAEGNIVEVERKYSDGSLAEETGIIITADLLNASPSLSITEAQVGDQLIPQEDGGYTLRKSAQFDTYKQFMYGIDSTGADVRHWGDWLDSYIPLGSLSLTDGFISAQERFGDEYLNSEPARRRDMILQARERQLLDEYGYSAFDLENNPSLAQTLGSLGKALTTPTSLVPVGAGAIKGAGLGGLVAGEWSMGQQLAETGSIDAQRTLIESVIGIGLGAGLGKLTKGMALRTTRQAQQAVNEATAAGLQGEDVVKAAVLKTKKSPDQIQQAINTAGSDFTMPGSTQAAEEAITKAATTDSAFSRLYSKTLDSWLGTLTTRMRNESEQLFTRTRGFEYAAFINTGKYLQRVQGFMSGIRSVPPAIKKRINLHLINGDIDDAIRVADGALPGLGDEIKNARAVYDDLGKALKASGHEFDELPDYWARLVKDVDGLQTKLGRETPNLLRNQKALYRRLLTKKGKNAAAKKLTKAQEETIANKVLSGFVVQPRKGGGISWVRRDSFGKPKQSNLQQRKLKTVNEDLLKYYSDPEEALELYIRKMAHEIEVRRFFGKDKGSKNINDAAGVLDREASIGKLINEMVADGADLSDESMQTIQELLAARFIGGAQSPGAIIQALRSLGYMGTIANPMSAITQLGDIGSSAARYGFRNTLKAMFEGSDITTVDLAIDVISKEFSDINKTSGMLERMFKYSGFKAIDRLGKNTIIGASINKARGFAKTPAGVAKLKAKWGGVFGDEFDTLVKDLNAGSVTENVKFLAFNELSDMQPISLSELPEWYLNNPNGRILYLLKSFTLKSIDVVRRNVIQEYAKGNKAEAIKQAALLAGYLSTANMGTGVVKDLLLGREVKAEEIPGRSLWGLLGLYGMNRYTADRYLANGQVKDAFVNTIMPATPLIDAAFSLTADTFKGDALDNPYKYVRPVPVVGSLVYNWFGGGAEAYNDNN